MEDSSRGTRRLALDTGPGTLANRFRSARFRLLEQMIASLPSPTRILDLGGTNYFWELRGVAGDPAVSITLANIFPQDRAHENITPIEASATDLPGEADGSYDLVFSNSTIEHLFTWEAQRQMASEVRRLAPAYFVQTPNFWFPVEPHFLTVGWHWLPRSSRVALLRRRRFGHRGPYPDPEEAARYVDEVRLLKPGEMRELFPDARLHRERIGPLTKSLIAVRGPAGQPVQTD